MGATITSRELFGDAPPQNSISSRDLFGDGSVPSTTISSKDLFAPPIGEPSIAPTPSINTEPLTPPSKSYVAPTLPPSQTQSAEQLEGLKSLDTFQEGTKKLGNFGGAMASALFHTLNPVGAAVLTPEQKAGLWEHVRQTGEEAPLDTVSNAAQLLLAGYVGYQGLKSIPEVVDYLKSKGGPAADWLNNKLYTGSRELAPISEESLADLYSKAPTYTQEEMRQAARSNPTLAQAIARVHGAGQEAEAPGMPATAPVAGNPGAGNPGAQATVEPPMGAPTTAETPPTSPVAVHPEPTGAITPQDLPPPELIDSVKATAGPQAQFAIPSLGVQTGTERMMVAAKKLGEVFNVTSANIMEAMKDATAAGQTAMTGGAHPDQVEMAANTAFFNRLPLLHSLENVGIAQGNNEALQSLAQALKSGDPEITKAFMAQIIETNPALSELFPKPPVALPPAPPAVQPASSIVKTDLEPSSAPTLPETDFVKAAKAKGLPEDMVMKEVYTDDLTGAWNRKFVNQKNLENEPNILFDVDNFKGVNDTHGHRMGDMVLQAIVEAAKNHGFDIARLGGEEFQVYPKPGENPIDFVQRFNQFQKELANLDFTDKSGNFLFKGATVSAGFGHNMESADNAAYVAKKSGKDQIHLDKKDFEAYNSKLGTTHEWQRRESSYSVPRRTEAAVPRQGEGAVSSVPGRETDLGSSRSSRETPPLNQPQNLPPDNRTGEHGAVLNPLAVADEVKAYLEKSRASIPISSDIQEGFNKIQTRVAADELRAKQLLNQVKLEPAEAEQITHHIDNPKESLTPHENEVLETVIKPILAESDKLYAQLENEGVPMSEQFHLRRFPAEKGGVFDRLKQQFNSVGGQSGILRQTTGGMKKRVMKAMTDEKGDRVVISVKGGDINAWNNKQSSFAGHLNLKKYEDLMEKELEPIQRKLDKLNEEGRDFTKQKISQVSESVAKSYRSKMDAFTRESQDLHKQYDAIVQKYNPNNLNGKVFVDKQGRRWTIGEATIKEIEKNTNITYHKNALLNTLQNYSELKKAQRAVEFIEHLKASPEFVKFAMKYGTGNIPEGWKGTDLLQLKGYAFEPRVADVLNHFNDQLRKGGDALAVLSAVNSFLRTTIFFNPLMHIPNIATHWMTARGTTPWLNPMRYGTLYNTTLAAIKSVASQNENYLRMLDNGVNLQYHSTTDKLRDMMLQKMGEEIKNNNALSQGLADALGYASPAKFLEGWYKWSGKATWFSNDVAIMQSIFEEEAKGKPRNQAIEEVTKHIPDYRIPSRVLGSRAIASIMSNPLVTMFSSYHYGALKSYGEMLKSTINPKDNKERLEAFDKMAMLGVLMFVLYPVLDKAVQYLGGDNRYKMRRAGSTTFPAKTYDLVKGKIPFGSYLQSVLTPSVVARLGMETWDSTQKADKKGIQKGISALENTIAPVGQIEKFRSGKLSMKEFMMNLIGAQKEKPQKPSNPWAELKKKYNIKEPARR